MTSPSDPANWPSTPPPLPPTLPTGAAAPGGFPPPLGPAASPPSGPTPPGPSGARTGVIAGIIAVVVVLALAATFVVVRDASQDETATPPASTTTTEAPTTTERETPATTAPDDPDAGQPPAGDIQAEVDEIARFVEQERGLEFTEEVEVTALSADDFKARVLDEFETEQDALETEGALLRAGGIVPPDTDIVQSQLDLLGDGVLGFYDPTTAELVVRSDSAGPMVRSVIAHELTHALDDQHFDLDRPELTERDDGSDWGFLALVEGSAKRVENAYLAQLSAEDQEQLQADQMELALDQLDSLFDSPLVLAQILMSPYDYGAPFVEELVTAGGLEKLDAAFEAPPTSSEQILDDTRYDGDQPVAVPTPPADGDIIDEGVLGELFTGFLVAEQTGLDDLLGGIDPEQLEDMLDNLDLDDLELGDLGSASGFPPVETTPGWGGDRYVVWEADGQVCVRVDWVMDTPEALGTFRGVLSAWAARDAAVTVADPTPDVVRATRCAPDAIGQNP